MWGKIMEHLIRGFYQEYLGGSWDLPIATEIPKSAVDLEGSSAEEVLSDAEEILSDTQKRKFDSINNAEINIGNYLIRFDTELSYEQFNGADYQVCSRQDVLDGVERLLNNDQV